MPNSQHDDLGSVDLVDDDIRPDDQLKGAFDRAHDQRVDCHAGGRQQRRWQGPSGLRPRDYPGRCRCGYVRDRRGRVPRTLLASRAWQFLFGAPRQQPAPDFLVGDRPARVDFRTRLLDRGRLGRVNRSCIGFRSRSRRHDRQITSSARYPHPRQREGGEPQLAPIWCFRLLTGGPQSPDR